MRLAVPSRRLLIGGAVVAVEFAAAAMGLAQVRLPSLDDVRRAVAPGDVVTIGRATADPIEGRVIRIGDTTLDVRSEVRAPTGQRMDITVPFSDLTSLERPRDASRDGAFIGASVGGGASLALIAYAAAVDFNEIDEWAPIYLAAGTAATAMGALTGWAIDRAHSKPHVRFDAPSSGAVTIRTVPLLWRRQGLAVVVEF